MKQAVLTLFLVISFQVCAQPDVQKRLQTQLDQAKEGETIVLDVGIYTFTKGLVLASKKGVTLKGQGADKTILDFKGQSDRTPGLHIKNTENLLLEALTIRDTKSDGITAQQSEGLHFRHVTVEWTDIPDRRNGAYGICLTHCKKVLLESCISIGASRVGIYSSQSKQVILRKCRVTHNVIGLQIENSLLVDVYENEIYENTAGILVAERPNLAQRKGGNIRIFNNRILNNNYPNFSRKRNAARKIPAGLGIALIAATKVDVFSNEIRHNNSIGTGIFSYHLIDDSVKDRTYDPYSTDISIHDNVYERAPVPFQGKGKLGRVIRSKFRFGKKMPDIIFDGNVKASAQSEAELKICIRNNQNASFANLDAANDFRDVSQDLGPYDCGLPPLDEVLVKTFTDKQ
ncbi:parallel beta-helix domain-containing protein [Tellurirhabdus bombi]|uniref:parallel beta-helix domain-containing protein n=1 Tax=Tellurirhabdus bombi TaxID=2907205 RepID=UPI001F18E66D|nr:parallel beta-helix domain-containing protein [Tellurirhabdus bombi]